MLTEKCLVVMRLGSLLLTATDVNFFVLSRIHDAFKPLAQSSIADLRVISTASKTVECSAALATDFCPEDIGALLYRRKHHEPFQLPAGDSVIYAPRQPIKPTDCPAWRHRHRDARYATTSTTGNPKCWTAPSSPATGGDPSFPWCRQIPRRGPPPVSRTHSLDRPPFLVSKLFLSVKRC